MFELKMVDLQKCQTKNRKHQDTIEIVCLAFGCVRINKQFAQRQMVDSFKNWFFYYFQWHDGVKILCVWSAWTVFTNWISPLCLCWIAADLRSSRRGRNRFQCRITNFPLRCVNVCAVRFPDSRHSAVVRVFVGGIEKLERATYKLVVMQWRSKQERLLARNAMWIRWDEYFRPECERIATSTDRSYRSTCAAPDCRVHYCCGN